MGCLVVVLLQFSCDSDSEKKFGNWSILEVKACKNCTIFGPSCIRTTGLRKGSIQPSIGSLLWTVGILRPTLTTEILYWLITAVPTLFAQWQAPYTNHNNPFILGLSALDGIVLIYRKVLDDRCMSFFSVYCVESSTKLNKLVRMAYTGYMIYFALNRTWRTLGVGAYFYAGAIHADGLISKKRRTLRILYVQYSVW